MEANMLSFTALLHLIFTSHTIEAVRTYTMFVIDICHIKHMRNIAGKLPKYLLKVFDTLLTSSLISTVKIAFGEVFSVLPDLKGTTRTREARRASTSFVRLLWTLSAMCAELSAIGIIMTSAKLSARILTELASVISIVRIRSSTIADVLSLSVLRSSIKKVSSKSSYYVRALHFALLFLLTDNNISKHFDPW
jgi:hypothetical protein